MTFIVILIIEPRNELPFELTLIENNTTSLDQPGSTTTIPQFGQAKLCDNQEWTLNTSIPKTIYKVEIPDSVLEQNDRLIVFQKAAINSQFAVLSGQPDDCWHLSTSGRSLPYDQRFQHSMFPNSEISNLNKKTEVYAVLQDARTRNLWLGISTPLDFQKQSNHKWLICGLYIGALLVYTAVGLSIAIWQKNKLALAYSCYTMINLLWFSHNFGIGDAFIPILSSDTYFN
jgi:hypothetical protein